MDAYSHYNVTLQQNLHADSKPKDLVFVFWCKTHPQNHTDDLFQPRNKMAEGASNLVKGMTHCLLVQGIILEKSSRASQSLSYSEANHRALITMRCAKSARPFNSILDEDYWAEVKMLNPNAKVPHPSTVSHEIYLKLSEHVKTYFSVSIYLNY